MILFWIIFLVASEAILQGLSPMKLGIVLLDYLSLPVLLFKRVNKPWLFRAELAGWASYRRRSLLGRTLKMIA